MKGIVKDTMKLLVEFETLNNIFSNVNDLSFLMALNDLESRIIENITRKMTTIEIQKYSNLVTKYKTISLNFKLKKVVTF